MQPLDVISTYAYCIFLDILETLLPGDKVRLSRKDLDEATTLDHHLSFLYVITIFLQTPFKLVYMQAGGSKHWKC
jgi:hypothetical protein